MTLKQKKQAEKILKALERQPFYDFYVGEDCEFDKYISNRIYEPEERKRLTKEILERIVELFELK